MSWASCFSGSGLVDWARRMPGQDSRTTTSVKERTFLGVSMGRDCFTTGGGAQLRFGLGRLKLQRLREGEGEIGLEAAGLRGLSPALQVSPCRDALVTLS